MSNIVDMSNRMNLDAPGLEAVKAAVEAGDYSVAETAYLAYYRARKPSILDWHTEHRGGCSFETNSTGWNFLTAIPELITWRDREKVKGLISRAKGYTFSRTEGIKSSDYTVLDLADMLLENKVFIPYHPEDGVQDLGPDWNWEHIPPVVGRRWTLSLPYQYCLRALAQAYWLTDDERYIAKLVKIATHYVSYVDGKSSWIWIPDMQLARNYQQLMPFILSWEGLSPHDFCMIQSWLSGGCAVSMEAVTGAPGNQLLFNGLGLAWIGVGMPEFKAAARWRERGFGEVEEFFGEGAFYPDGSSKENSYGYVVGASAAGLEALTLAQANGWDFLKNLHRPMLLRAEFLAYTAKPDGSYVWTGDSTRGSAFDYVEAIADSENRADLQYIVSFGEQGTPPPRKSSWYAYGGVGVMRSGWDCEANYLFFDVGPVGVLHGHEGKLAVEVVAYGRSLVEDLGIHTYATTERDMKFHDFFIASAAHNTVIVDGKSQARLKTGPFTTTQPLSNRWSSTATCDFLSGCYTEGYGETMSDEIDRSVVHHRSVIFIKGRKVGDPEYWIITDHLTGDGVHTCEQLFHLIPVEVNIDPNTKTVRTITQDQPNLAFIPAVTDGLDMEVVEGRTEPNLQGWYCGGGPRPTPAPCVTYRRTGMLPTGFQTVLLPMKPNEAASLKVESLGTPGDGWIRITFPDGREDTYCSSAVVGPRQLGDITFIGDAALIRRDSDGTLLDWAVVGGDNLEYRGEVLPSTCE